MDSRPRRGKLSDYASVETRSVLPAFRRSVEEIRREAGPPIRPGLGAGRFGGRVLLSASVLRIASYNIASSTNSDETPRSGLGTILQAIGTEAVNSVSRPIDVLALQEVKDQGDHGRSRLDPQYNLRSRQL